MRRHIKSLFSAVLILAVISVGVGAGVAQKDGGKLLSVQTGSMAPSISKGDLIAVNRIPTAQLAVGDVITFVSPTNNKKTITHRIIELPSISNKNQIITKGDANSVADAPMSPKYVLGKVRTNIPYIGFGIDFIRQPVGLAILIYLPALLIIIGEIRKLSEHYRKMRPYISPQITRRLKLHRSTKKEKIMPVAMITVSLVVISLAIALPVRAALISNSVVMADSSFTVTVPPVQCPTGSNSTNTNINITGGGGNNNNNVNVNNNNNQNATSGNATGTNATSGNATNTNCTNINITVTNH